MMTIKKQYKRGIRACALAVACLFFINTVSWAYPATGDPKTCYSLAAQSPFQKFMMTLAAEENRSDLRSDISCLTAILDVGEYLLEEDLPLNSLGSVMKSVFGKDVLEGIQLDHAFTVEYFRRNHPREFHQALEEMGAEKSYPDSGVVIILYTKDGKKGLLQVALKTEVDAETLPGELFAETGRYIVKALLPEKKAIKKSDIAMGEDTSARIDEEGERPLDIKAKKEKGHDLSARSSLIAGYVWMIIGGVLLVALFNQGYNIATVIGMLFYLNGIARYFVPAWKIYSIHRKNGLTDRKALSHPIAQRSDSGEISYDDAFFNLGPRIQKIIVEHEYSKSHFWALVGMMPGLYLLTRFILPHFLGRYSAFRDDVQAELKNAQRTTLGDLSVVLARLRTRGEFCRNVHKEEDQIGSGVVTIRKFFNSMVFYDPASRKNIVREESTGVKAYVYETGREMWNFRVDSAARIFNTQVEVESYDPIPQDFSGKDAYGEILSMMKNAPGNTLVISNRQSAGNRLRLHGSMYQFSVGLPITQHGQGKPYMLEALNERGKNDDEGIFLLKGYPSGAEDRGHSNMAVFAIKGNLRKDKDIDLVSARSSVVDKAISDNGYDTDKIIDVDENGNVTVYLLARKSDKNNTNGYARIFEGAKPRNHCVGPLEMAGFWVMGSRKDYESFEMDNVARAFAQIKVLKEKDAPNSTFSKIIRQVKLGSADLEDYGILPARASFGIFDRLDDGEASIEAQKESLDILKEEGVRRIDFSVTLLDILSSEKKDKERIIALLAHAKHLGMRTCIYLNEHTLPLRAQNSRQDLWDAGFLDAAIDLVDLVSMRVQFSDHLGLENSLTAIARNLPRDLREKLVRNVEITTTVEPSDFTGDWGKSMREKMEGYVGVFRKMGMYSAKRPEDRRRFSWRLSSAKDVEETAYMLMARDLGREYPQLNINYVPFERRDTMLYLTADGQIHRFSRDGRYVPIGGVREEGTFKEASNRLLFWQLKSRQLEQVTYNDGVRHKKYLNRWAEGKMRSSLDSILEIYAIEGITPDGRRSDLWEHVDFEIKFSEKILDNLGGAIRAKARTFLKMAILVHHLGHLPRYDNPDILDELRGVLKAEYKQEGKELWHISYGLRRMMEDIGITGDPNSSENRRKIYGKIEQLMNRRGRLSYPEKELVRSVLDPNEYGIRQIEKSRDPILLNNVVRTLVAFYGDYEGYVRAQEESDGADLSIEHIRKMLAIIRVVSAFNNQTDEGLMKGRRKVEVASHPQAVRFMVRNLEKLREDENILETFTMFLRVLRKYAETPETFEDLEERTPRQFIVGYENNMFERFLGSNITIDTSNCMDIIDSYDNWTLKNLGEVTSRVYGKLFRKFLRLCAGFAALTIGAGIIGADVLAFAAPGDLVQAYLFIMGGIFATGVFLLTAIAFRMRRIKSNIEQEYQVEITRKWFRSLVSDEEVDKLYSKEDLEEVISTIEGKVTNVIEALSSVNNNGEETVLTDANKKYIAKKRILSAIEEDVEDRTNYDLWKRIIDLVFAGRFDEAKEVDSDRYYKAIKRIIVAAYPEMPLKIEGKELVSRRVEQEGNRYFHTFKEMGVALFGVEAHLYALKPHILMFQDKINLKQVSKRRRENVFMDEVKKAMGVEALDPKQQEIARLLYRKKGCTEKDIYNLGWKAVGMEMSRFVIAEIKPSKVVTMVINPNLGGTYTKLKDSVRKQIEFMRLIEPARPKSKLMKFFAWVIGIVGDLELEEFFYGLGMLYRSRSSILKKLRSRMTSHVPVVTSWEQIDIKEGRQNEMDYDPETGTYEWVQGMGMAINGGVSQGLQDEVEAVQKHITNLIQQGLPDGSEVDIDRIIQFTPREKLHFTIAQTIPNSKRSDRPFSISRNEKAERRWMKSVIKREARKARQESGETLRVKFNLNDILIDKDGNIVLPGHVENMVLDNMRFALTRALARYGRRVFKKDIVHVTVGRIFVKDEIPEEAGQDIVRFIHGIRNEDDSEYVVSVDFPDYMKGGADNTSAPFLLFDQSRTKEEGKTEIFQWKEDTRIPVGKKPPKKKKSPAKKSPGTSRQKLFELVENNINNHRAELVKMTNEMIAFLPDPGTLSFSGADLRGEQDTLMLKRRAQEVVARLDDLSGKMEVPENILSSAEKVKEYAADLETETVIALLISLARAVRSSGDEKKEILIAIEEGWIPGNEPGALQHLAINSMMGKVKTLDERLKRLGLDNITLLTGEGQILADNIDHAVKTRSINPSNVIVMGSRDFVVNSRKLNGLRSSAGKKKAFLAGIDPSELNSYYREHGESQADQMYIPLMEMMAVTLELACGKEVAAPDLISEYNRNDRLVFFLPRAVPMGIDELKSTYLGKETILLSA